MSDPLELERLVAAVREGAGYRCIDESLIRQVAQAELAKGRKPKETVKAVRNKLHQVGGAYQEGGIDYPRLEAQLAELAANAASFADADLADPALREFCERAMRSHASTRERLPDLDEFYAGVMQRTGALESVLDVACGLNPLALPWMGLPAGGRYLACDIYTDMVSFLNKFFAHTGCNGRAFTCNLLEEVPAEETQAVFILKTIPCLEQVDRTVGARLLDGLRARWLVVSFPSRSLGGRSKGMAENYTAHFHELLTGRGWALDSFDTRNERIFVVDRGAA